jgi:hypothetical protein
MILLPLLVFQISTSWAVPREHPALVIPVHDIVRKDLSAHETHPHFELYTRWLETPVGSYIGRDPEAAFKKHSNVRSIDCNSKIGTCLITSTIPLADPNKSKRENDEIIRILEEQQKAREEDPAALFERAINKRSGYADTLFTQLHLKTYHDMGNDGNDYSVSGFQHFIDWNLKVCGPSSELVQV